MATVTEPIMTDATGQSIDSKLNSLLGKMDNLAAAFQPNASGIVYSNTTSGLTGDDVQEAIDEMAADVSEIKQSLSNEEITSSDGRITFTRQGKHRLVQFNRAERSVITTFFNSLLVTDCPKTFATGAIVMTDANISPAKYYRLAYAYIEGTTRPSITIVYNSQYNANQGEQVATTATERFIGQVEWYTA